MQKSIEVFCLENIFALCGIGRLATRRRFRLAAAGVRQPIPQPANEKSHPFGWLVRVWLVTVLDDISFFLKNIKYYT